MRLLLRAAALAAPALLFVACSSSDNSPATTGTGASSTAAGSTSTPEPGTPLGDLRIGLDALTAGYHFVTTVTVNDQQSLVAEGDRMSDSTRLQITSGGATIDYVITPAGNYSRPSDGDWEQLEVAPATTDPIAALRSPIAVRVIESTDGAQHLTVTVTAASLGLATGEDVEVEVVLQGGTLLRVVYVTASDGGTAQVSTDLSAITDTTPITAPV